MKAIRTLTNLANGTTPLKVAASAVCALVIAAAVSTVPAGAAGQMSVSRDTNNPVPSAPGVSEQFTFGNVDTSTPLRCLRITYSANADGTGTIPGLDLSSVVPGSNPTVNLTEVVRTANSITVRDTTPDTPAATQLVELQGIVNGSAPNTTYFAKAETFTDYACTDLVDFATAAFVYTNSTVVSVDVEPTMTFTVAPRSTYCGLQTAPGGSFRYTTPPSGSYIDLGRINAGTVGQGAHNLTVATNAAGGAAVYARGAHASSNLRAGGLTPFPDTASPPIAGTANFTYTVSNTHNGLSGSWKALTGANAEVAHSSSLGFTDQCIGFSAASSSSTPAGQYQATVFYTAVPQF